MLRNRPAGVEFGDLYWEFQITCREFSMKELYDRFMHDYLLPPIEAIRLEELVNFKKGWRSIPKRNDILEQEIRRKLKQIDNSELIMLDDKPLLFMYRSASELYMRISVVLLVLGIPHLLRPLEDEGRYMFCRVWLLLAAKEFDPCNYTAIFWNPPPASEAKHYWSALQSIMERSSKNLSSKMFFKTNKGKEYASWKQLLEIWRKINRLMFVDGLFDCDNSTRRYLITKYNSQFRKQVELISSAHFTKYAEQSRNTYGTSISFDSYQSEMSKTLFCSVWLCSSDVFLPNIYWGLVLSSVKAEEMENLNTMRNDILARLVWSNHIQLDFLEVIFDNRELTKTIGAMSEKLQDSESHYDVLSILNLPKNLRRRVHKPFVSVDK